MNKKVKSIILLFLTAVIWGFAFVAQLDSAGKIGSLTFNASRFFLGALSLIPVIAVFDRRKMQKSELINHIRCGMIAGVLLFSASTLQQFGIVITNSAGKSGFMTGLYTVLVPVIGFIFLKRKNSVNIWLGVICAVTGLFMLCILGSSTNESAEAPENAGIIINWIHSVVPGSMYEYFGMLLLFIGSILWALHIIYIDSVIGQLSPLRFSMTQFFVCALLSTLIALLTEFSSFAQTASEIHSALIPILYGGLLSVGVAYTCQTLGQRDADPTFAAIVLSTESVFSAIGEALFYGLILKSADYKGLGSWGYVGCAVIFAGIVISQLDFSGKKNKAESE